MPRHRNVELYGLLFSADSDNDCGWRVVRQIARSLGEAMVADGAMRRVLNEFGTVLGYQSTDRRELDVIRAAWWSSQAAISSRESRTNAGLDGKSRTYGLREEERIMRAASGRPAEDRIERVQGKVRLWLPLSTSAGCVGA